MIVTERESPFVGRRAAAARDILADLAAGHANVRGLGLLAADQAGQGPNMREVGFAALAGLALT